MAYPTASFNSENTFLQTKYRMTSWVYDIFDYPWERQYRKWRPLLLKDISGEVLEAGVGTGRNLRYYSRDVNLTGIDLSDAMLKRARKRARQAVCKVNLHHEDATVMASLPSGHFDWLFSSFLCCVMPDNLQPIAIQQFERVLKPGGRFRLLEMIYSKNPRLRKSQEFAAPFVEKVYGARFDRHTLNYIKESPKLKISRTFFLKDDIYLVIEGTRV